MGFTFIDSDGTGASANDTTIASPGLTVNAGDLVVALVTWENAATTCTMSDGTSSLTQWAPGVVGPGTGGQQRMAVFYILASVASGTNSVVYTATFGTGVDYRNIVVMVFTPSGAVTTDGSPTSTNGSSTSGASGNTTTGGTDGIAFGAYAEYGGALSAEAINGVAFEHRQIAVPGTFRGELWNITYASGFTGQATCTLDASIAWIVGVIGFQISGGGAANNQLAWITA